VAGAFGLFELANVPKRDARIVTYKADPSVALEVDMSMPMFPVVIDGASAHGIPKILYVIVPVFPRGVEGAARWLPRHGKL
jgi:hypothetical protein